MYLLEYRNKSIQLMLANEEFSLPENLIIMGTMNTADRSTRSLDIAMRRRFSFFELLPDVEILKKFYASGMKNELGDELFTGFENLNMKLLGDLDKHFTIGHSFFMRKDFGAKDLQRVWKHQVLPLMEEYFFSSPAEVENFALSEFFPSVS